MVRGPGGRLGGTLTVSGPTQVAARPQNMDDSDWMRSNERNRFHCSQKLVLQLTQDQEQTNILLIPSFRKFQIPALISSICL